MKNPCNLCLVKPMCMVLCNGKIYYEGERYRRAKIKIRILDGIVKCIISVAFIFATYGIFMRVSE